MKEKQDLTQFENLTEPVKVQKETEKAIAVEVPDGYYSNQYGDYNYYKLVWIPKSVAQIKDNMLIALKGWFIEKQSSDYGLISNECVARFEAKYCK